MKSLRLERGWTLEQMARETGVSRSALSKIERSDISPTFDALLKLSRGLRLELPDLLSDPPGRSASGRRSIVRGGDGERHDMEHYRLRLLVRDLKRPAFIPYEFTATARSVDAFAQWDRHDSDDYIYVLSGIIVLHTELYEPVELHPGDSIYFDARMGHAIVSGSDDPARALCVSAPERGQLVPKRAPRQPI
ncbi:MAG TPA: XRE family transcriptional regulator [Aliidongia sp.]|uniref:helix-turn-helix domain-containing protein n=1 Tax=Aliidongia sp. TaxID=1914230 RepID=UPI002DDCEF20|nr:XRE family transcriptional regulator [Aliidongia sp.]HEV2677965.1 XRE family transcriptional regulator [Aliidongia sp.]